MTVPCYFVQLCEELLEYLNIQHNNKMFQDPVIQEGIIKNKKCCEQAD